MMAAKARLLADIIEKSLNQSEVNVSDDEIANNTLHDQLNSFKQILIHDITLKGFARYLFSNHCLWHVCCSIT